MARSVQLLGSLIVQNPVVVSDDVRSRLVLVPTASSVAALSM